LVISESAPAILPEWKAIALPRAKSRTDYAETWLESILVGLQRVARHEGACGYSTTETTGLRHNRQPPRAAEESLQGTRRQRSSSMADVEKTKPVHNRLLPSLR